MSAENTPPRARPAKDWDRAVQLYAAAAGPTEIGAKRQPSSDNGRTEQLIAVALMVVLYLVVGVVLFFAVTK